MFALLFLGAMFLLHLIGREFFPGRRRPDYYLLAHSVQLAAWTPPKSALPRLRKPLSRRSPLGRARTFLRAGPGSRLVRSVHREFRPAGYRRARPTLRESSADRPGIRPTDAHVFATTRVSPICASVSTLAGCLDRPELWRGLADQYRRRRRQVRGGLPPRPRIQREAARSRGPWMPIAQRLDAPYLIIEVDRQKAAMPGCRPTMSLSRWWPP